jgi:hypothetical protein
MYRGYANATPFLQKTWAYAQRSWNPSLAETGAHLYILLNYYIQISAWSNTVLKIAFTGFPTLVLGNDCFREWAAAQVLTFTPSLALYLGIPVPYQSTHRFRPYLYSMCKQRTIERKEHFVLYMEKSDTYRSSILSPTLKMINAPF